MPLNVGGGDSLFFKTGIDTAGMKRGSAQAMGIVAGLTKNISRADVFAGLGLSGVIAFGAVTVAMTKFTAEFKKNMIEVSTISDEVTADIEGVSASILELSRGLPLDAAQLAKAEYQIISAGITDVAESLNVLTVSAELATAGLSDVFTVADALTSIMNAYGESAGTAEQISDDLFTTVRLGKITLQQLSTNIGMVTGLAAQVGLEFTDLSAAIAEGTKTVRPEIFFTAIRGLLTSIIRPSEDAAKVAKALGIEWSTAALRAKGLGEFLRDLSERTGESDKVLGQLVPNVRGLVGLLAVARKEGKGFADAMGEFVDNVGSKNEALAKQLEETGAKTKIFWNNMKVELKSLGDVALSVIDKLADVGNKIFDETALRKQLDDAITSTGLETLLPVGSKVERAKSAVEGAGLGIEDLEKRLLSIYVLGDKSLVGSQLKHELINDIMARQLEIETQIQAVKDRAAGFAAEQLATEKEIADKKRQAAEDRFDRAVELAEFEEEYAKWKRKNDIEEAEAEQKIVDDMMKESYQNKIDTATMEYENEKKFNDWKIDNSKELTETAIAELQEKMLLYSEEENYLKGHYDRLKAMQKNLSGFEQNETKKRLTSLLKDYRNFSMKKLEEYKNELNEELKLETISDEERESLRQEERDVDEEIYDKKLESIKDIAKSFRNVSEIIADYNDQLAIGLSLLADMTEESINLGKNISSGNIAGTIASVTSLMVDLYKAIKKIKPEGMGKAFWSAEDSNLRGMPFFETGIMPLIREIELLDNATEKLPEIIKKLEEMRYIFGEDTFQSPETVHDFNMAVKRYTDELNQILTATTADSISDGISDGFASGLDSAEVFANSFNNIMTNVLNSIFERTIQDQFLNEWYDNLAKAIESPLKDAQGNDIDDKPALTSSEAYVLGEDLREIINQAGTLRQTIFGVAGLPGLLTDDEADPTQQTGISGRIQGITETTAGLLEGQFNAMRIDMASMRVSMLNLDEIADNTERTADNTDTLHSINNLLLKQQNNQVSIMRSMGIQL